MDARPVERHSHDPNHTPRRFRNALQPRLCTGAEEPRHTHARTHPARTRERRLPRWPYRASPDHAAPSNVRIRARRETSCGTDRPMNCSATLPSRIPGTRRNHQPESEARSHSPPAQALHVRWRSPAIEAGIVRREPACPRPASWRRRTARRSGGRARPCHGANAAPSRAQAIRAAACTTAVGALVADEPRKTAVAVPPTRVPCGRDVTQIATVTCQRSGGDGHAASTRSSMTRPPRAKSGSVGSGLVGTRTMSERARTSSSIAVRACLASDAGTPASVDADTITQTRAPPGDG